MKKITIIFGVIFIIVISVLSCRNEDVYNSVLQNKEYASKSPWKEDQVYIKNVKSVFEKYANQGYFENKYGQVYWDYAMSFGKFDESFLVVPIVKKNKVATVMKVIRNNDRIFLLEQKDSNLISFFDDLINRKLEKFYEEQILPTSSAEKGKIEKIATDSYVCTYRTITVGCFETEINCTPISRTVSSCQLSDTLDDDYINTDPPGENGSGGGSGQGLPYPNQNTDPCATIKAQNESTNYKIKLNEYNKASNFSEKKENGFYETKDGWFYSLEQSQSTSSSDGLKIPISSDIKGYTHTHLNDYEDGTTDENGTPVIRQPIRMFSPADVNALMELAKLQSNGNYGGLYGVMLSSSGNYTIKFTVTAADIKTGFDTDDWREDYKKFVQKESGSLEKKFLRFLSEKMGVKGISLFKNNSDGKTQKKSLTSNNNVQTTDCP